MVDITIASIETSARSFVDAFSDEVLVAIVRGEYPAEFADFSLRRRGVYERAALIVLDVRANDYPKAVKDWSQVALKKRIEDLRNTVQRHSSAGDGDDIRRRRELASGTKLETNWQLIPINFRRSSSGK